MLKEQRQLEIIKIVEQKQFVKVEELAQQLSCAEITIRRDIQQLADMKKIEKVHGGAKALGSFGEMRDFEVEKRERAYIKEKKKIAQTAATFIKDGMSIYLDAGSTVSYMIQYLKDKDVYVYTHGIHHIALLLEYKIPFSIIGGSVKPKTQATVGEMTIKQLQMLHFNLAFMGANAFDSSFGFSTPDISEGLIKQTIIEQSDAVYILMDQSKLNKKSQVRFATLEDVTAIITEVS